MLKHFAVPVKNLKVSEEFYVKYFGLEVHKYWERKKDNLKAVQLIDENGIMLELICDTTKKETCSLFVKSIIPHIGFMVKNIEEKMESFEKQGVKIIWPIEAGITVKKIAFIEDLDGFPIELIEEIKS